MTDHRPALRPVEKTGIPLFQAMIYAPIAGANVRWPKVIHAIDVDEICATWGKRLTCTAVCGAKRLRPMSTRTLVVEWPVRVKGLAAQGFERCKACHDLTGRKRPRSWFKTEEEMANA
jgi:hypothetical protein